MNRSKIVAIITGAISILLAVAYLIIIQILDYRDMKPAPLSLMNQEKAGGAGGAGEVGEAGGEINTCFLNNKNTVVFSFIWVTDI